MLYTAASQFHRCKDNISPNRSSFLFIGTKALVVIGEGEFERGRTEEGRVCGPVKFITCLVSNKHSERQEIRYRREVGRGWVAGRTISFNPPCVLLVGLWCLAGPICSWSVVEVWSHVSSSHLPWATIITAVWNLCHSKLHTLLWS